MPVLISDLWTPDLWVKEMRERQATFPSVLNSGVCVRNAQFDGFASGAGVSVNIPFFKDITDQADEVQVENAGPTTDNGIGTGKMVTTVLNRVTKNSVTALSAQVSGADPMGAILDQLVARRMKQRNKTLIAVLRGAFGSLLASGAAAPLQAMRFDNFDESGNDATAQQTLGVDMFIDAKAALGELADDLLGGCILIHPTPLAALEKADATSFKEGKLSGLPFAVRAYRGIPLFVSESLARAGTTNGFVYETYVLASGIVAMGEKPQAGDVIDVASLQYQPDKDKNNEIIYDRTRFLMHMNGMKWVGTPAGQSATNTELQTVANWNLVWSTANRVGGVCIRTNK